MPDGRPVSDRRGDRWGPFSDVELSELSIALDHRLGEAEAGNAYVWWGVVVELLADLYYWRPELSRDQTWQDVEERGGDLTKRDDADDRRSLEDDG